MQKRISVRSIYAFFFIGVSLIPIISSSMFWIRNAGGSIRDENVKIAQFQLNQFENYLNNQFNEILNLSMQMSYNNFLRLGSIQTVSDEIQAIKEIKKFNDRIMIADNTLLYSKRKNVVFTKNSKYDANIFFDKVFGLDNYTQKLENMLSLDRFTVELWSGADWEYIVCIYPLFRLNITFEETVVIFILPADRIGYAARGLLGGEDVAYHIVHNGELLLSSLIDNTPDMRVISEAQPASMQTVILNGINSVLITTQISNLGFKYAISAPADVFWHSINELNRMFIYISFTALVLNVAVALVFIMLSYKPIKQIEKSLMPLADNFSKNELSNIKATVDKTIKSNYLMKTQLFKQRVLLIDNLFWVILKKGPDDNLLRRINALGVFTDHPYYAITVLEPYSSGKNGEYIINRFIEHLNIKTRESGLLYVSWLSEEKHAALLWGLPDNDREHLNKQCIEIIRDAKDCGIMCVMYAGYITDNISSIHHRYVEAILTGKFKNGICAGEVMFYENTEASMDARSWYPVRHLLLLSESIKQGNRDLAQKTLDEISALYQVNEHSLFYEYSVCADIVNNVMKTASEIGINDFNLNFKRLNIHGGVCKLCADLSETVAGICAQVFELRNLNKNKRIQDALDYISDNFHKNDLSLDLLSNMLSVSVSRLSSMFKNAVGIGFKEYIIMLRMEKAKTLLRNTNMNVAQISDSIGYINPSHFIKIFKDYEGMTPNGYRNEK